MITPAELQDLVFAYIYRAMAVPGGCITLRFSEVERAFETYVGPRLVRTALERTRMTVSKDGQATCLIETDVKLYEKDELVGGSDWVIKGLTPTGEAKVEREISREGGILNRYLRRSEPLTNFFAS